MHIICVEPDLQNILQSSCDKIYLTIVLKQY